MSHYIAIGLCCWTGGFLIWFFHALQWLVDSHCKDLSITVGIRAWSALGFPYSALTLFDHFLFFSQLVSFLMNWGFLSISLIFLSSLSFSSFLILTSFYFSFSIWLCSISCMTLSFRFLLSILNSAFTLVILGKFIYLSQRNLIILMRGGRVSW